MAKVGIPFRPCFRDAMLSGVKVMTCRPRKMGEPGDTFEAFCATFVLTHVMRMRLGYAISDAFVQEGCKSVQELQDIWISIHPKTGCNGDEIVWAHCFRFAE